MKPANEIIDRPSLDEISNVFLRLGIQTDPMQRLSSVALILQKTEWKILRTADPNVRASVRTASAR